jgi:TctA family transporter
MLTIPYKILFPVIIAFPAIGTFSLGLNAWHVFAIAFFGVLGYALIKLGCEPAPLLLGFVLGPLLEDHLVRSLIISRGDLSIFISRPISAVLLAMAAAAIVIAVLPTIRRKREVVFKEEEDYGSSSSVSRTLRCSSMRRAGSGSSEARSGEA